MRRHGAEVVTSDRDDMDMLSSAIGRRIVVPPRMSAVRQVAGWNVPAAMSKMRRLLAHWLSGTDQ